MPVTVQQLIDSLSKIENKDMEIEVALTQYNKVGYVEYIQLNLSSWDNCSAESPWGKVRLFSSLPYNKEEFTILSKRKMQ